MRISSRDVCENVNEGCLTTIVQPAIDHDRFTSKIRAEI